MGGTPNPLNEQQFVEGLTNKIKNLRNLNDIWKSQHFPVGYQPYLILAAPCVKSCNGEKSPTGTHSGPVCVGGDIASPAIGPPQDDEVTILGDRHDPTTVFIFYFFTNLKIFSPKKIAALRAAFSQNTMEKTT